jgi:YVTN family beta-propeller protein
VIPGRCNGGSGRCFLAVLALWLASVYTTATYSAEGLGPRSNSLLALSPGGETLLVANTDSGSVSVVDPRQRRLLREIPVGRKPEAVALVPGHTLAVVTLYDDDALVLVDWATGRIAGRLSVLDEPYGVVVTTDGAFAYVTHDFPGAISEVDLSTLQVRRVFPIGQFLRGLAITADDRLLYVTEFHSSALIELSLATGQVTHRWMASPQYNLARHVALHPTRAKAYLPHVRSRVEEAHGEGSMIPLLSIVDRAGSRQRKPLALDTYNGFFAVANPWEVGISRDGRRLYIVYAATNDMHVNDVLDDDYFEIRKVGGLVRLGRNPRAVAVSPDGREVYVYNLLDFEVQVLDAERLETVARLQVTERPYSERHWRGKVLFFSALQPMVGRRWISCASCHPDGQPDLRTWRMPQGLRNTPSLAGLRFTHPLHWSADRDEVQDFEWTIRSPLMQGQGLLRGEPHPPLGAPNAGRSEDLDALAEYCNSIPFTPSPFAPQGRLSEAARRGQEIFHRKDVGCADCHRGPYYTDGLTHDVGTGRDDPTEQLGTAYDTPTLLGVYRTAPYLHHGRARTLLEVLTTYNQDDRHGRTSHLAKRELEDLVDFLKALPSEGTGLEGERAGGLTADLSR